MRMVRRSCGHYEEINNVSTGEIYYLQSTACSKCLERHLIQTGKEIGANEAVEDLEAKYGLPWLVGETRAVEAAREVRAKVVWEVMTYLDVITTKLRCTKLNNLDQQNRFEQVTGLRRNAEDFLDDVRRITDAKFWESDVKPAVSERDASYALPLIRSAASRKS